MAYSKERKNVIISENKRGREAENMAALGTIVAKKLIPLRILNKDVIMYKD